MIERVGQQLGSYRLLRLIGRGSFAEVYLGEHLHLGTQAAIKVLYASLTDEGTEQLRSEARTMARLIHPHIVRVLDFQVEDGLPFLVMEYAPNGSLRLRHPHGSIVQPDRVVSYVEQVAEALSYMHAQKLIHRDVKPENMLLGSHDEVLLTEFGVATISQSSRSQQTQELLLPDAPPRFRPISQSSRSRQTQEAVGSVIYMAPEQLRGKPRSASDQYALGVVAYEWLCGEPPFTGPVQLAAMQHLSAPPPLLRSKIPAISSAMEEVVLKALAKEPELRYPNVQAFAQALEEAYHATTLGSARPATASKQMAGDGKSPSTKPDLPTGTVTLLFAEMEGSTRLLQQLGDRYADALAECRQVLRGVFQEWNGYEVDTQGDAFFVAFARATDAVLAALDAQRALAAHPWPEGVAVRVRMGIHTGEPARAAEGYIGLDVHRAARIMSAAHGGQVLLSRATATLVEQDLPEDVSLRDLGEHRLKDLGRPWHLFQALTPDLPADFPHLRTLDAHQNNLPVQLTPFIGREQELDTVQNLLGREDTRLLTLTGPGGTGKTRLGLQTVAELSDRFADGVFFVNLAPIIDPALIMPAIAQTLDIREGTGRSWLERLREVLQQKQVLLLLDNFEQVVSAGAQVVELLAACPQLKILVTSREALHVRGEREFAVPPMALPDLKNLPDLAMLSNNTAIALFVQRAQAVKPDFQLTSANARAIVEICARLDGLPLAIELAAARIKLLPPQALLARLNQRLTILTGNARDVPARQQTLRNTIAWSYNLLDAAEQRLFRWLSIFVGGCTLEAAEAVCVTVGNEDRIEQYLLDTIASLLDKSLLRQTEQEDKEPRFMMLETIREYGLERLIANGEIEAAQQAHADYYLILAEKAELELTGPQQVMWLERIEQEYNNLRAAMEWCLEREEVGHSGEMALRLAGALRLFWFVRGHYAEASRWLEEALARSGGAITVARTKALRARGNFAAMQGDRERAKALCEESLSQSRALGDKSGTAHALYILGGLAMGDNHAAARSLAEEALELFRQLDDQYYVEWSLYRFPMLDIIEGEYTRARAQFEEFLLRYRKQGNKFRIASTLSNLANILFLSQGDRQQARLLLEEGLALFKEVGAKGEIAYGIYLLGRIAFSEGDINTARLLTEESLALFPEIGVREGIAVTLSFLATLEARQGEYVEARSHAEEALMLARKSGDKEDIAICLERLAEVVATQGELVWAIRLRAAGEVLREDILAPLPPVERAGHEQMVARTRVQIGERAFATFWAEGRCMTLDQAIAAQGSVTISDSISIAPSSPSTVKPSSITYPDGLTAREVDVLRLVAQGLADAQIAEQLVISPRTVNSHLTSIYSKIQVSSRVAATRYAMEHRLV